MHWGISFSCICENPKGLDTIRTTRPTPEKFFGAQNRELLGHGGIDKLI
jgi:hypothetical protein